MSGFWLKIIACICMVIDHTAEIFDISDINMGMYLGMKYVGRLAFPIFAFLIVQGYQKTNNLNKYLFRLGLFALVSEIPYDISFYDSYVDFDNQNVFFTLFFGIVAILLYETFRKSIMKSTLIGMSVGLLAEYMNTDYGAMGVWLILFLFVFREEKSKQYIAGVSVIVLSVICSYITRVSGYTSNLLMIHRYEILFSCSEVQVYLYLFMNLFGVVGLLCIWLYNEKKGYKAKIVKYLFYVFYPFHIMFLYFLQIYTK